MISYTFSLEKMKAEAKAAGLKAEIEALKKIKPMCPKYEFKWKQHNTGRGGCVFYPVCKTAKVDEYGKKLECECYNQMLEQGKVCAYDTNLLSAIDELDDIRFQFGLNQFVLR